VRRRMEREEDQQLGVANSVLSQADRLLDFTRDATSKARLVPSLAWSMPCPPRVEGDCLKEYMPRFCSAFALAARAAAERRIDFDRAMAVPRGGFSEEVFTAGLRAMIELAPELLGFFFLFWQTLIKTSPHYD